jgi:hypothetical protein
VRNRKGSGYLSEHVYVSSGRLRVVYALSKVNIVGAKKIWAYCLHFQRVCFVILLLQYVLKTFLFLEIGKMVFSSILFLLGQT